jgi:hypothetical protein
MKHIQNFESFLNEALQPTNEIVALCTAVVGILGVEYGLNPDPSDVSLEMAGFFDGVEHGRVPEVPIILSNLINDWIGEYEDYEDFKTSYNINKSINVRSFQLAQVIKEVQKFNLTAYKKWSIGDIADEETLEQGVEVYNDIVILH